MPKDDLEIRFAQAIDEQKLIAHDQPVVVAVSGGPDSVVLLHLLHALNQREGWSMRLHFAHLNHQLRGEESNADAEFVANLAHGLYVPCTIESADVNTRAAADGVSIEHAGRACRLEFFERVCLKQGINAVALAHHADDNVETILHRIMRGTGIRGLVGIPSLRPIRPGSAIQLIRPLLGFRRAEIEHYLYEKGIVSRHDKSNVSLLYTRNRIRHELLPLLRERFNPQVDDALLRLAEHARGLDAYLSETGERTLESLVIQRDDRQVTLHAPALVRKPRVLQTQLIRQVIVQAGIGEAELSYVHLNAVADLAAGQEGSKSLHLPGGLRVTRRYSKLIFERVSGEQITTSPSSETRVATDGTTPLPEFGLEFSIDVMPGDEATISAHIARHADRQRSSYEEWIDADQVRLPLIARSRRSGDRFFPLGMGGVKKISDFLIDEKIDAGQRERVVLLCDQFGPIWVVPYRIDDRVRLNRVTRNVLRIRVRPMGTHHGE